MPSTWKILIVDDDDDAHVAAKIHFKRIKVSKKPIEIISAYTVSEAISILKSNPDISLMIVDMVMEDDDSGSQLIERVRKELKNKKVRIIIRSGCIDLAKRMVEKGFAKMNDVDHICDKGDSAETFTELVIAEIKRYKLIKGVFYLIKIFFVKIVYDIIKKSI